MTVRRAIASFAILMMSGLATAAVADDRPAIWQGFYVGGYGAGTQATRSEAGTSIFGSTSERNEVSQAAYGVYGGYNLQVGSWVFGAEADSTWPRSGWQSNERGFYSLRARAGYAVGSTLMYATAGYGIRQASVTWANPFTGEILQQQKENVEGFVVGGGIEYRIFNNFALRAEALYHDASATFTHPTGISRFTQNERELMGRLGLTVLFQ